MESIIQQQTNNSDSNYLKMLDGTSIQWGYIENPLSGSSYSGAKVISFNSSFVGNYNIVATPAYQSYGGGYTGLDIHCIVQAISNTTGAIYIRKTDGTVPQYPIGVFWIAIGRWK